MFGMYSLYATSTGEVHVDLLNEAPQEYRVRQADNLDELVRYARSRYKGWTCYIAEKQFPDKMKCVKTWKPKTPLLLDGIVDNTLVGREKFMQLLKGRRWKSSDHFIMNGREYVIQYIPHVEVLPNGIQQSVEVKGWKAFELQLDNLLNRKVAYGEPLTIYLDYKDLANVTRRFNVEYRPHYNFLFKQID